MGDRGESRSLTRSEFDAVIRRAAELSSSESEGAEGELTEGELFRIAGEVGLSEAHVRRALVDVRGETEADGPLDRVFGPSTVRASRVVEGTPEELIKNIDEFLVASRLLQRVRRTVDLLQYRPAVDWASQLARAASFSSWKYYIASARLVEVSLEPVDDERTLVQILVEPGTRSEAIIGSVLGGGSGGAVAGVVCGGVIATFAPFGLAVAAGVVLGGGVSTGIVYAIGRSHRRNLGEAQVEVEGVLDALESGASLEPPPASWRRWVKRQFHGMARDSGRGDGPMDN